MNKILANIPETLETERLVLTSPKAGFGSSLSAALNDGYEDAVRYLNWPSNKPSVEEVEIECRRHHADFITREAIRYLIIEKASNQVVGRCGLPPHLAVWDIPQFSLAYFIRKSRRNVGFATEASKALIKLALTNLAAKKIEIYCEKENLASHRVPQKLGFALEYSKRGSWPRPDGELAVLDCYSIFRGVE